MEATSPQLKRRLHFCPVLLLKLLGGLRLTYLILHAPDDFRRSCSQDALYTQRRGTPRRRPAGRDITNTPPHRHDDGQTRLDPTCCGFPLFLQVIFRSSVMAKVVTTRFLDHRAGLHMAMHLGMLAWNASGDSRPMQAIKLWCFLRSDLLVCDTPSGIGQKHPSADVSLPDMYGNLACVRTSSTPRFFCLIVSHPLARRSLTMSSPRQLTPSMLVRSRSHFRSRF